MRVEDFSRPGAKAPSLEVFFFASSADSLLAAIRSTELGRIMKSYFEAAWNAATPIKSGAIVHAEEVAYIRRAQRPGDAEH